MQWAACCPRVWAGSQAGRESLPTDLPSAAHSTCQDAMEAGRKRPHWCDFEPAPRRPAREEIVHAVPSNTVEEMESNVENLVTWVRDWKPAQQT